MAKKSIKSTSKKKQDARVQEKDPLTLKQSKEPDDSTVQEFVVQRHGILVLFHFTTSGAQHQALARVESFYESRSDASNYISLRDPKAKVLCQNYQAFNLPIISVRQWLQAMRSSEKALSKSQSNIDPYGFQGWWCSFTKPQESHLLAQLWQLGCFKTLRNVEAPEYLFSVTNKSAIQHELLHAVYFLHPGYRDKAQKLWMALSKKCRLVISQDLLMRGYGENVWVDEFQAYVSEDGGEFGKHVRQECNETSVELRAAQNLAWKELDLNIKGIL